MFSIEQSSSPYLAAVQTPKAQPPCLICGFTCSHTIIVLSIRGSALRHVVFWTFACCLLSRACCSLFWDLPFSHRSRDERQVCGIAGSAKKCVTTTLWFWSSQLSSMARVCLGKLLMKVSVVIYKGERWSCRQIDGTDTIPAEQFQSLASTFASTLASTIASTVATPRETRLLHHGATSIRQHVRPVQKCQLTGAFPRTAHPRLSLGLQRITRPKHSSRLHHNRHPSHNASRFSSQKTARRRR